MTPLRTSACSLVDDNIVPGGAPQPVARDWREALPVLAGSLATLREPEPGDAPALFSMLRVEEVARFITPPPPTVEGFERFIDWARRQRAEGACACFAVVPHGMTRPAGVFQVRRLEPSFGTAEWGFAIGAPFWGSGLFDDGARLVVDFAFTTLGAHRLEARAAARNGRGNGALQKLGAVREGVLRRSFLRNGEYHDQVLWSLLREDWMQTKAVWGSAIH